MFGSLGPTEIVLILGVLVLLFGPKQLPKLGRSIGEGIREFRNVGRNIIGGDEEADDDDDE